MAAGKSTRMKSKISKVAHQVSGKPIIQWVADALFEAGCSEQVYVVGEQQEQIRSILGENVIYVLQEEQRGTGHAVMQASGFLEGRLGVTIVLPGDCPMVSADTIKRALAAYEAEGDDCAAMIITAVADDPTGYGRVLRDSDGSVDRIIEHRDCTEEELKIKEINSSMYVFRTPLLISALGRIGANNSQSEYYLTDTIGILKKDGYRIGAVICDIDDTRGVNDCIQLSQVQAIMNRRILENHMRNGVQIVDPASTWIHSAVRIASDTVILPGTTLVGDTVIGSDCIIGENTRIDGSVIGDGKVIDCSVVTRSVIGSDCRIGPFSHIRPDCNIADHVTLGAYVEVKSSDIGEYTRARHLTYIGDSSVGKNVNFGCGTVTCNFDGQDKAGCTIEDNVFIGGNSNIVSSVVLGRDSYIAAGSTITSDVPALSLGIGRSQQVNKADWVSEKSRMRGENYIRLDDKRSEV